MSYLKNKSQGFTLLELVLYVAIAAVVLGAISSLIFILWQARIKNKVVSEVEQQGMFAIKYLTNVIKQADTVLIPTQANLSSNLELVSSSFGQVNIFEDNGRLAVVENNGNTSFLTGENVIVKNLSFSNFSRPQTSGLIGINFSLENKSSSVRFEYNYQSNFSTSQVLQK
jgi:type II secretory pathway pseudopilin PulG